MLTLEYDGTDYEGWQTQGSGRSIQENVEAAILSLTGRSPRLIGSGRTDSGVHAFGQVASFKTDSTLETGTVRRALNALLPLDIRVVGVKDVGESFHARYGALEKVYSYHISNGRDVPVFLRRYVWRPGQRLDASKMKEAAGCLVGRHDFSAFAGSGSDAKSTVREVFEITVKEAGCLCFLDSVISGDLIKITLRGNAFLRHMARNIVGTLYEAGRGRMRPSEVGEVLKSGMRSLAGPTAPAMGLFLERVVYPD